MWDYLIKSKRRIDPKEKANIRPVHNPGNVGAENKVQMDDDSPSKKQNTSKKEFRNLNCPVCHAPMHKVILGKTEIDKCPECRGVFLDQGELELISKYSLSSYTPSKTGSNSTNKNETEYLIYTPHGLSNHVMDHD